MRQLVCRGEEQVHIGRQVQFGFLANVGELLWLELEQWPDVRLEARRRIRARLIAAFGLDHAAGQAEEGRFIAVLATQAGAEAYSSALTLASAAAVGYGGAEHWRG